MPLVAAESVSIRLPMPGMGLSARLFCSLMMLSSISLAVLPWSRHSSPRFTQSCAKLPRASWNPLAWPSAPSSEVFVGSTTASKTARPTFFGKRWA